MVSSAIAYTFQFFVKILLEVVACCGLFSSKLQVWDETESLRTAAPNVHIIADPDDRGVWGIGGHYNVIMVCFVV